MFRGRKSNRKAPPSGLELARLIMTLQVPVQLVLAWVVPGFGQEFGSDVLRIATVAPLVLLTACLVWVSAGDDSSAGCWAPSPLRRSACTP